MKTMAKKSCWVQFIYSVALFWCASGAYAAVTKTELAGNSLSVYPFF
jgi:hypothetical protein